MNEYSRPKPTKHMNVHAYMHICMYCSMHIYIYHLYIIYILIYIYIHTYIYTYIKLDTRITLQKQCQPLFLAFALLFGIALCFNFAFKALHFLSLHFLRLFSALCCLSRHLQNFLLLLVIQLIHNFTEWISLFRTFHFFGKSLQTLNIYYICMNIQKYIQINESTKHT